MRRLSASLIAIAALLPATALVPAAVHAAETGTIRGRVILAPDDTGVAGVRVTLTGQNEDGSGRLAETATTDARGRFEFEDLPTGADRFYALDVMHEGGLFSGRAISLPDDTTRPPVIDTTLRVWSTTTDPAAIVVRRDDMFVVPGDGPVTVIESVVVVNLSDDAYIGRGGGTGATPAQSLGFALPRSARDSGVAIVESSLDIPQIIETDFGFAATAAVPPGETRITFTYQVPGSTGFFDLTRTALYPVLETSVFVADPLVLTTDRLRAGDPVTLEGREYLRYTTDEDLSPGDSLQMQVTADAGSAPVVIGLAIAGGIALIAGIMLVLRRVSRKRRTVAPAPAEVEDRPDRDALVALARLDADYTAGRIGRDEWQERRSSLKAGIGSGQK